MPRIILSDWEKRLNKNIRSVKKAVRDLERMNLKIELAKDVETMMGNLVDHVYVIDKMGERICLQKHLFTVNQ